MNRTNNGTGGKAGKGKPHLTNTKLLKYGVTTGQQIAARLAGLKWCGGHKQYEEPAGFDRGCKLCRVASRTRDLALYKKNGNARKYHVSKGWYEKKFEEQDGHCALCPATISRKGHTRLCIDHDHHCCKRSGSCGKCVRGLLCLKCNHRVGHFEIVLDEGEIFPYFGTWSHRAKVYIEFYRK